jgi:sarcosine oxidase subunit beta
MSGEPSPDAIVIGAGLIGTSVAYHLARAGVRPLLIEQGDLASGASGANFGNVQVQDAEFGLSLDLTLQSYARFAELEAELDYDVGFNRTGSVLLAETEPQMVLLQDRASRLRAAGVGAALLDRDEVCQLEPQLARRAPVGALYHADEGRLNPFRLVHAFVLRGRNLGLEVWKNTKVWSIEVAAGRAVGVMTPIGRVSTERVIIAAGAWSHALAKTAGLDLPLQWVHGEAVITEALPPLTANSLTTAAFFEATEAADRQTVGFCLRQRPHGNVMIGEAARVTRSLSRGGTPSGIPAMAAEARRWLPTLGRTGVIRTWAIPVAFTADRRPLLGPAEGVENLLVAAGFKSTIILTPLVGELVAGMVTSAPADSRLAEFSPTRRCQG